MTFWLAVFIIIVMIFSLAFGFSLGENAAMKNYFKKIEKELENIRKHLERVLTCCFQRLTNKQQK